MKAVTRESNSKLDTTLSAIRRGERSLPALRQATGIDYSELHLVLYELEFEWRAITKDETNNGFSRYRPVESEKLTRPRPVASHWRAYPTAKSVSPLVSSPSVKSPPSPSIESAAPRISLRNPSKRERNCRYELIDRVCAYEPCGRIFLANVRKKKEGGLQRFCTSRCGLLHFAEERVKVPRDYESLYKLYVIDNMTTPEIAALYGVDHHTVSTRLNAAGIPLRPTGTSRWTHCCEEGCNEPSHKVLHKTNGSWYGKRCYAHWRQFRVKVNKAYLAKTQCVPTDGTLRIATNV